MRATVHLRSWGIARSLISGAGQAKSAILVLRSEATYPQWHAEESLHSRGSLDHNPQGETETTLYQ